MDVRPHDIPIEISAAPTDFVGDAAMDSQKLLPVRPFRFGVIEMVAVALLFGVQLSVLRALVDGIGDIEEPARTIVCAIMIGALTFGSAFLSARAVTERKWKSPLAGVGALLAIDLGFVILGADIAWLIMAKNPSVLVLHFCALTTSSVVVFFVVIIARFGK